MKIKHRPDIQETKRGFSAPSPHLLRRFSANESGKGVEMVR
jgi:hypothetical protein